MINLDEQILSKVEAIDICTALGEKFIEHFDKIYSGNNDSELINHQIDEMQSWFDNVFKIKVNQGSGRITKTNLIDWFFTCGANIEDFISSYTGVEAYEDFYLNLLLTKDVKKSLEKLDLLN